MASTKTIYKSVTLQPGEPFTLPPGAVLISAESPDDISSTCDIDLEELACYTFVFGNAASDGNNSQLFESETAGKSNVKVIGISVNGTDYLFSSPQLSRDDDGRYLDPDLINAINSTAAGQVLLNASYGYWQMGENGTINYITFQGAPSVAEGLSLILSAYVIAGSGPSARTEANTSVKFYIKPVPTDTLLSSYNNVPQCI